MTKTNKVWMWNIILLLLVMQVSAIEITSISAPNSVDEGTTTTLSFSASSNQTVYYQIYKDNQLLVNSNTYNFTTTYQDSGTYKFTFLAYNSNETINQSKTITVNNIPINIVISNPTSTVYGDNQVEIEIDVAQTNNCTYEIENVESGTITSTKTVTLNEGNYILNIQCSLSDETKTKSVAFSIDKTAPAIIAVEPDNTYSSPVQGENVKLEATTNENSSCRFSNVDETYDEMDSVMSGDNSRLHHYQLTDLSQGTHNYYVRCKDRVGNIMQSSKLISFYSNEKPTAEVDIDGPSRLNEGRYEITLTTSELLSEAPTLRYNFQDDSAYKTITLTGSDKKWTGYLVIDGSINSIGAFDFIGKDLDGLTGTEITEGKLFIVDTQKPDKISSLKITQEKDDLELVWHYDGEEAKRFKIYRSLESGVDYTDYYDSSVSANYKDTDVEPGVTYFYKVSVEDEASNEGDLSEQVYSSVEAALIEKEPLKPSLVVKVVQLSKEIESTIFDVEWSITELEGTRDLKTADIIEKLGLIKDAQKIKTTLQKLLDNTNNLKDEDISEASLDQKLNEIKLQVESLEKDIVKQVTLGDRWDYEQDFDNNDYSRLLGEFANYRGLDMTKEFEDYNRALFENTEVQGSLMHVNIEFVNGDELKNTIITKTVSLFEPTANVGIVEEIPKTISPSTDYIIFSETPRIIKKDPIVEFRESELSSKTYYYIVEDEIPFSEFKKTQTHVFGQVQATQTTDEELDSANEITGFVLDENTESSSGWILILGTIIISGLLVYYFFFIKEDEIEVVDRPTIVKKQLPKLKDRMLRFQKQNNESAASHQQYARKEIVGNQEIIRNQYISSNNRSNGTHHNPNYNANQTTKHVMHSNSINDLISKAHHCADRLDMGRVHKLYLSILHLYEATEYSSDHEKREIRNEITKIYGKIMLYNKIRLVNKYLKESNNASLQKELQDVKKLLDLYHVEPSYFYNHIQSLHDHFSIKSLSLGK